MHDQDIRRIVEEIMMTLERKGLLKGDCGCKNAQMPPMKVSGGFRGATIGTAGKVFGGDWERPASSFVRKSNFASDLELEHTGQSSCPACEPVSQCSPSDLKGIGCDRVTVCKPTKECSAIARLMDHTLLKPNATQEEVGKLCEEARAHCFASVCVNPTYVALCARLLQGSGVKVCTVIGFPLGSTTPTVKAIEARDAIANGADEVDMVINIGALKSGNETVVFDDIRAVREASRGKVLKTILETALLSDAEKVRACVLAKKAGADFVKTSTGFGGGGATVEDVRLMRETVGPMMGVKASGGIRDAAVADAMVKAGATRLGTSASVAIATGASKDGGKGY